MKPLKWSHEKNQWLLENRGISFEDIQATIQSGCMRGFIQHHNSARYPGQAVLLVQLRDYIWMVPYVEEDDYLFLKTIIPSRKAARDYLRNKDERH